MTTSVRGAPSADPPPQTGPPPKPPVSWARLAVVSIVLAIAVGALGVVLLRDAVIHVGWVTGDRWLPQALDALPRIENGWWLIPAGILAVLVGLWLVVWSSRPKKPVAAPLVDYRSIYLRGRAIEAIVTNRARDIDGVHGVQAKCTRSGVTARVTTTGDPQVGPHVDEALRDALAVLGSSYRIKVRSERVNE